MLRQIQDVLPVCEQDSQNDIFQRESLVARCTHLGECPLMFPIQAAEAWDIDEALDFRSQKIM